ncbi:MULTISPECIES: DNA polymerase III subunit beta [Calothrix]|uniref:DNA polymerase III subunit beta n=2 Tax=Calothrix TaxID=1186 RepID=A0ABR8A9H6_9CYAN|nr:MULTISPECIES: DNA polymerase III subunit beta [Calothrix]MBD2195716.1 DNA polymerase III subunit beta [Calothrix parietina FACHB-288]MBD2224372.1 DNA polymerase III subunit beta [Calothrix anomala FACHB-343]
MKLNIEQSKLAEILETAYLAISPKPTDPILGNILLIANEDGIVSATGTNLNLTIHTTTTANVETSGQVALPAKLLTDTINNVRGEITLEVENQACIITHNSGKCRLIGGKPDEFPTLPKGENPIEVNLSAKKLQAALEGTLYCTNSDETKLVLTGVNFKIDTNKWQAASTNGHKLALVTGILDSEYSDPIDFTVPGKSLSELNKILSQSADTSVCNILLSNKTIEFSLPNTKVISRLLEGEYPKINSLIPRTFEYEFTLERKGFESALKRVSYLAERKQKVVKILWELEATQATLYTEATDIGDAVDSVLMKPATSHSENISIGLNIDYLLEGLKHIGTDEIVVRCNKPTQPVIICPMGGLLNQLYLVMPVEIKQGFEKVNNQSTKTEVSTQPEPNTEELTDIAQATNDSENSEMELPSLVAKDTTKGKSTSRSSRSKKEVATA